MKPSVLIVASLAAASCGAAAQTIDRNGDPFGSGMPGIDLPGRTAASLPPSLNRGLIAATVGVVVPGMGAPPGIGPQNRSPGIGLVGGGSLGAGGFDSRSRGGLRADLFGRLPSIAGSGTMLGTAGPSSGLLDFLATPAPFDPLLANPPSFGAPALGGSSSGASSFGGGSLADPFCRPENFTC